MTGGLATPAPAHPSHRDGACSKPQAAQPALCWPAWQAQNGVAAVSNRRARSAPQCGVSRGPRASRVRAPISSNTPFRRVAGIVKSRCRKVTQQVTVPRRASVDDADLGADYFPSCCLSMASSPRKRRLVADQITAPLAARKQRGAKLGNPTNAADSAALGGVVQMSEADRFAANFLSVIRAIQTSGTTNCRSGMAAWKTPTRRRLSGHLAVDGHHRRLEVAKPDAGNEGGRAPVAMRDAGSSFERSGCPCRRAVRSPASRCRCTHRISFRPDNPAFWRGHSTDGVSRSATTASLGGGDGPEAGSASGARSTARLRVSFAAARPSLTGSVARLDQRQQRSGARQPTTF